MPLISHFYGILIRMFFKDKEQHNRPHFHAVYAEYTGTFTLEGEQIAGNIPKKQLKLIAPWATIHEEELMALWKSIQETGDYFTIKGLE